MSGATEWVNGEAGRDALLGSPVLVHFWAHSCSICHDNMATVAAWRDTYGVQGLKVVAVHMPREEHDLEMEAVYNDLRSLGITEPCAMDNQHAIGEKFGNSLWPAYFLFDIDGTMKSRAAGYAGLKMIEDPLRQLMAEVARP